jgi:hypothetical protein
LSVYDLLINIAADRGKAMSDEQQDIDSAAEHQHELEQRQQLENSGAMDSALFTRPLCPWPRITPEDQFRLEMHQLKVINFALDKIFGEPHEPARCLHGFEVCEDCARVFGPQWLGEEA